MLLIEFQHHYRQNMTRHIGKEELVYNFQVKCSHMLSQYKWSVIFLTRGNFPLYKQNYSRTPQNFISSPHSLSTSNYRRKGPWYTSQCCGFYFSYSYWLSSIWIFWALLFNSHKNPCRHDYEEIGNTFLANK